MRSRFAGLAGCLALGLLPTGVIASPFVNATPSPELAGLRPVQMPEPLPSSDSSLPVISLRFIESQEAAPATVETKVPFADVWQRLRAGFRMSPLNVPEVRQAEASYASRSELVARIFERSRPYLFHIIEEVERRGLPTELALLPFVESGFDPFARSSAQAMGLWQFIPKTALRYRLVLNDSYDARRDVIASTTAALDYLEFLHGLFGDWPLALAAYNWGEDQLLRAIERNRARGLGADFASLALPDETRNYVPRLMAVRNMVLDQSRYRITLPPLANSPYFVAVPLKARGSFSQLAKLAEMEVSEFKALNAGHADAAATMTITTPVVRVDRALTFMDRLRAFVQRKAEPGTSRSSKPPRRTAM